MFADRWEGFCLPVLFLVKQAVRTMQEYTDRESTPRRQILYKNKRRMHTGGTMTQLQEAKAFFSQDQFAVGTTGIEIEAADTQYARCSLKLDNRHRNAIGQVMGGVIFTLADFVFAVAANFGQPVTVTAVGQISFLGIVKGDVLYGESRLLKEGNHSCFYQVTITDDLGNSIAQAIFHGIHLPDMNLIP